MARRKLKLTQGGIDWLKIEREIKGILRRVRDQKLNPFKALYDIDWVLGGELERGYTFEYPRFASHEDIEQLQQG